MATPARDRYEQDATHWAAAAHVAIATAIAAPSPADRTRIFWLCVTSQRQTFVLVH